MEVITIAHIVEASFAGVGRHVLDLASEQANAGYRVHVIYSPVRASASFLKELQSLPIEVHPIRLGRGLQMRDMSSLRMLRSLLREIGADVLHGHSTKGGLVARVIGFDGVVLYTPNAIYSMNPSLNSVSRRMVGAIERFLARRTTKIIAVSPEEESHLREIGIAEEKLVTIPNAISKFEAPERDTVRAEQGVPEDVPLVGFVGRLDSQKAPMMLIEIMRRVAQLRPDTHFVIVGSGPQEGEVRRSIAAFESCDRFHVLGEQPGRRMMSAFDVFLLPSRYEGFPYVLLEAADADLRIVTTDRANASLLFDSGEAVGEVVPYNDRDALVAATVRSVDAVGKGGGRCGGGFGESSLFRLRSMAKQVEAQFGFGTK